MKYVVKFAHIEDNAVMLDEIVLSSENGLLFREAATILEEKGFEVQYVLDVLEMEAHASENESIKIETAENILSLTVSEQIKVYKQETGSKEINVCDFDLWIFDKMLSINHKK